MDSVAPIFSGIQTAQLSLSSTPANIGYDHVLGLVGQHVSLTLVEKGAGGARLELPSGQMLTAQGDLPFPEQTQLQVRISFQNGAIRLQVLGAQPPSPASILGPLIQGEAMGLFQQLQAPNPPEALIPLVQLFEALFSSNELQLQQAIDSLPASTQQLLSLMLGIKNANPAMLSRMMMEQFEPITSLLDKITILTEKQMAFDSSFVNNKQQLNTTMETSVNTLRDLLLKFSESNFIKQGSNTSTGNSNQTNQLTEILKPQLLSNILPMNKELIRITVEETSTSNNLEKLMLALKLLPNDVRNNLSNNIVGLATADIETIAKTIFEKLEIAIDNKVDMPEKNLSNSTDAKIISQKLIQTLENMPIPVRRGIASALLGSESAEPKKIAEFLLQKIIGISADNNISKIDVSPQSIKQILTNVPEGVRSVLSKILAEIDVEADPHTGVNSKPDAQRPSQLQENFPAEASVKLDTQRPIKPQENLLAEASVKLDTQRPIKLQENLSAEASVKLDTQRPIKLQENLSAEVSAKLDTQRLIQALENLPISIRRAIALATMNDVGAKPEAIAEFLVQKGIGSKVGYDMASKLETVPPALRQLITILAKLPLDMPSEKMAETLLNGDKAILAAAKALLSMEDDAETMPVRSFPGRSNNLPLQDKDNAQSPNDIKSNHLASQNKENSSSTMFTNRLGYLLQFEMLNSQNTFPMEDKNSLSSWFRSIVDILLKAKAAKLEASEARQIGTPNKSSVTPHVSNSTQARSAQQSTAQRAANTPSEQNTRPSNAALENPQTWQTWVKGSIQALINPRVSAKESVFHALVAKEGINFFELPLPWMPSRQMEIWIETDADDDNNRDGKEKETHRILLALNFTVLGETRVGIESVAKRLNVKIWAEHPFFIENELPKMQNELSALGFDLLVSIQPLIAEQGGAIPSIKSLINGSSLHAVG